MFRPINRPNSYTGHLGNHYQSAWRLIEHLRSIVSSSLNSTWFLTSARYNLNCFLLDHITFQSSSVQLATTRVNIMRHLWCYGVNKWASLIGFLLACQMEAKEHWTDLLCLVPSVDMILRQPLVYWQIILTWRLLTTIKDPWSPMALLW